MSGLVVWGASPGRRFLEIGNQHEIVDLRTINRGSTYLSISFPVPQQAPEILYVLMLRIDE